MLGEEESIPWTNSLTGGFELVKIDTKYIYLNYFLSSFLNVSNFSFLNWMIIPQEFTSSKKNFKYRLLPEISVRCNMYIFLLAIFILLCLMALCLCVCMYSGEGSCKGKFWGGPQSLKRPWQNFGLNYMSEIIKWQMNLANRSN